MKYKVTYTLQREVSVIVDIKDKKLNKEFKKLGKVQSDADFNKLYDPRWKIEEEAYKEFSGGEHYEDGEESIVDRSILKFKD